MLLLIAPSNLSVMPYVRNHLSILEKNNVDFELVIWDRLHLDEEIQGQAFKQKKEGHKRTVFDYLKYRRFIRKNYDLLKFEGVIVYGLQLSYFLRHDLKKIKNYMVDIRDYNKIIKYYDFQKIIENSYITSISSNGFLEWLPRVASGKYVIHHNVMIGNDVKKPMFINAKGKRDKIKLGVIGSIRNPDENIPIIDMIGDDKRFELYFHGDGWAIPKLKNYVLEQGYSNIYFTGRYSPQEESTLYQNIDWSVIPLEKNRINSRTLLPNRLYNGIVNDALVLTTKGTYTGNIVEKYDLGLAVNLFDSKAKDKIVQYSRRKKTSKSNFLDIVNKENNQFEKALVEFGRRS